MNKGAFLDIDPTQHEIRLQIEDNNGMSVAYTVSTRKVGDKISDSEYFMLRALDPKQKLATSLGYLQFSMDSTTTFKVQLCLGNTIVTWTNLPIGESILYFNDNVKISNEPRARYPKVTHLSLGASHGNDEIKSHTRQIGEYVSLDLKPFCSLHKSLIKAMKESVDARNVDDCKQWLKIFRDTLELEAKWN